MKNSSNPDKKKKKLSLKPLKLNFRNLYFDEGESGSIYIHENNQELFNPVELMQLRRPDPRTLPECINPKDVVQLEWCYHIFDSTYYDTFYVSRIDGTINKHVWSINSMMPKITKIYLKFLSSRKKLHLEDFIVAIVAAYCSHIYGRNFLKKIDMVYWRSNDFPPEIICPRNQTEKVKK